MAIGEIIRLGRFFENGNLVVVATDHGGMNGPVPGLENYPESVEALKEADAILLQSGMITRCLTPAIDKNGEVTIKGKMPKLIVRLNWMTNFFFKARYHRGINCQIVSVAEAVGLGADAVMASFQLRTGDEKVDAENVSIFADFIAQKRKLGIPLFGEVYPDDVILKKTGEMHNYVQDCCRIVAEQGADIIKTFYTGKKFSRIVNSTPIPILVLGASKSSELEALQKAYDAVNAGARGVVFGRNIFQSRNPGHFLEALIRVVKRGENPTKVSRELQLT